MAVAQAIRGRRWIGGVLIVVGASTEHEVIVAVGGLVVVPLMLWLFIIPILHWKDRYVGERSGAWGALPVCETRSSGSRRHRGGMAGVLAALLGCMTSAHAMSRCPTEFGSKDPRIDLLGWAVVASGVLLGGWRCVHVVRRSRGLRRWRRVAVVLAGGVAMLLLWSGSLGLAIAWFFLRC